MALQHFRSALNGFNRQDVVTYIELINNQHNAQVAQLKSQLQAAQAQTAPADSSLQEQLDAANARIAELEAQLAATVSNTAEELEAYRRAERAERAANERAQSIRDQANAVLAEATVKAEAAAQQIGSIADQVTAQLQQYQDSICGTKATFQEAVAALYAIRPEEE